jgi:hypothetical protein
MLKRKPGSNVYLCMYSLLSSYRCRPCIYSNPNGMEICPLIVTLLAYHCHRRMVVVQHCHHHRQQLHQRVSSISTPYQNVAVGLLANVLSPSIPHVMLLLFISFMVKCQSLHDLWVLILSLLYYYLSKLVNYPMLSSELTQPIRSNTFTSTIRESNNNNTNNNPSTLIT